MAEVSIRGVSKAFGAVEVLRDVDIDIADGDWLPTAEAIEAAAAVGVPRIVQIGCDLPGARWAVQAAAEHPALTALDSTKTPAQRRPTAAV